MNPKEGSKFLVIIAIFNQLVYSDKYLIPFHIEDKESCTMLFVKEVDLELAFVRMMRKLQAGHNHVLSPFVAALKDANNKERLHEVNTLESKIEKMMDNVYIKTDPAGNIKADKAKSTEKIDDAVATIMALDRAIRCGNSNTASVYDERGILFL